MKSFKYPCSLIKNRNRRKIGLNERIQASYNSYYNYRELMTSMTLIILQKEYGKVRRM